MLASLGCEPLELGEVRRMIGDGVATLVARALAARGRAQADHAAATQTFMRQYEAGATSLTTVYPGVDTTLQALHAAAIPLAVCTNKPAGLASRILEHLGLTRYFAQVLGGDSLPFRKPDPRVLLALVQAFDTTAQRSLLVGDSEVDAATAAGAGVPFVLMSGGYRRGAVADIVPSIAALESFAELPALLGVPLR